MGKKMARCYSGMYEVKEVLREGWVYTVCIF